MSGWQVAQGGSCGHAAGLVTEVATASECEDCVREGSDWVHLRRCLACQHVGCCDNSPRRHATAHWRAAGHPVMASAEPGEDWAWCYPDELMLVPAR
jgi:ubiquitin-hydrolase Zn-finger-containing protein